MSAHLETPQERAQKTQVLLHVHATVWNLCLYLVSIETKPPGLLELLL